MTHGKSVVVPDLAVAVERLTTLGDAFELWGAHGGNLINEDQALPMSRHIKLVLGALAAAPPPSSLAGGEVHYGDPCIRCGVGHDDVSPGPCRGDDITISRERARAVLGYLKNGRGSAGWPTQLWVEVQHFIANIEAALSPEAPAREGVVKACAVFQEAIDYFEADVADALAEDSERADLWDREVTVNIDALKTVMQAALTPRHEATAALCDHGHTDPMALCSDCEANSVEAPAEGAGEAQDFLAMLRLFGPCTFNGRTITADGLEAAIRARSSAPEAREGEAELRERIADLETTIDLMKLEINQ